MARRLSCLLVAAMLLPLGAHAVTITLTGNNPTTRNVAGPCNGAGGPYASCGITSYLDYSNTLTTTDLFTNLGSFNTQPVGEESFATGVTGKRSWSRRI